MLGAFARTSGLLSLGSLKEALQQMDFRDAGLSRKSPGGRARLQGNDCLRPDQGGPCSGSRVIISTPRRFPDDLAPIATVLSKMLPGDWRSLRPVIDRRKCVKCALCWLYCPVQCVRERPRWFEFDLARVQGLRRLRPGMPAARHQHDRGGRPMSAVATGRPSQYAALRRGRRQRGGGDRRRPGAARRGRRLSDHAAILAGRASSRR